MSGQAFISDDARNELTKKQYDVVTVEDVIAIVQKDTGISVSSENVNLYDSESLKIGKETGMDGLAIHLHLPDKEIDQVYYIYRGTHDGNDAYYNATGIAAASNTLQLDDAEDFFKRVNSTITNKGFEPANFGDGHSLGGHVVINLALKINTSSSYVNTSFVNVRGLNDAPINTYTLSLFDEGFNRYLENSLGIKNPQTLPEKDLIQYTKEYYSEPAQIIEHVRVKGEPLYAQDFRGKLYIGSQIHYLGDLETEEFTNVAQYPFSHLSWMPFFKLQELRYNAGISSFIEGFGNFDRKIGLEKAKEMYESPLGRFILGVNIAREANKSAKPILFNPYFGYQLAQGYQQRDQLEYHGIAHLTELYRTGHMKTYFNMLDPIGGMPILLDREELLLFMEKCQNGVGDKQQIIRELRGYIHSELEEIYSAVKFDIGMGISALEANPGVLLPKNRMPSYGILGGIPKERKARSIVFDESFEPIEHGVLGPLEEIIQTIEQEIKHLEKFIQDVVVTLDVLFDRDKELASTIRSAQVVTGGSR
ncbi:hypothetical protein M3936_21835 [Sutcliffiella horikoshii]|uniref:DUF6792 domain-containing protein n=1 Tax=Sutcliffiella horikoshii TaxID=79883 RepID=UPI0020400F46|nr:DUF6792 domain-containing protein [Sutcliffiella horikoshii]MCM3620202.1 hypothetical protein [Sutcliffiella horikoshii]